VPETQPIAQTNSRPTPATRPPRPRRTLRAFSVLLGLAMLMPVATFDAPPVFAGGSCTGWQSRYVPPETIRVRRADDRVEIVDFRRYVGVVMAKEWPGWVPEQAREAGAVAVKQYGWYYALEGHHRSSYVNARGQCYDVRDSTSDQLYKPERVTVGEKIWRVVDTTWGLSVRKSGRFFLTGYRAGTASVCASDANGWKLFAKSVMDCADRGWSRERIQTTYYAPDVTFHWGESGHAAASSLNAPLSPPTVNLRTGKSLRQRHALITWDENRSRPAGARYQLQRLVSGSWSNVSLPDATRPRVALRLRRGVTHDFRVRLRDSKGNAGPWYSGPRFDARMVQDTSDRISWSSGDWQRISADSASGGTLAYTTKPNSQAKLRFTGRAVGVVASTGPNRGRAKIYVNNNLVGRVDLYSRTQRWKVLVFTREWARSKERVIRVEVEGTVGRPRVDIDGVLFYR
jgi:hypothetical protein